MLHLMMIHAYRMFLGVTILMILSCKFPFADKAAEVPPSSSNPDGISMSEHSSASIKHLTVALPA